MEHSIHQLFIIKHLVGINQSNSIPQLLGQAPNSAASSNSSDKNTGSTSNRESLLSSPEHSDSGDESHTIHSDDEMCNIIGGPMKKKKTRTVFSRHQVSFFQTGLL